MRFSPLTNRLSAEEIDAWSIHTRAREMQTRGEDVILLSIGDPNFDTPSVIVQSAIDSLNNGRTHYTPAAGITEFRDAVAHYHREQGLDDVTRDHIVIVPGAQCGMFAAAMCVLCHSDSVIIPEPMYVTYDGVVASTRADLINVPLRPENDFHLDTEDVRAALRDDTKAIIINTPHNPTGTVMRAETIEALGELCEQHDLWLLSDEVYADLAFERPHVSPLSNQKLFPRTAGVFSLSKAFAMPGWRMGWVCAPPALVEHIEGLMSCMLFGTPPFIQDASITALKQAGDEVRQMRDAYLDRRDMVCRLLSPINKLHCHRPEAGMYVMIDVRDTGMDGNTFANRLLDDQGVSLLPGEGFGKSGRGHVRFSTCEAPELLEEACRRIVKFTESLAQT